MEYKFFGFGDMTVVYALEADTAVVTLVPAGTEGALAEEKMNGIDPFGNKRLEPSMQVALEGDAYPRELSAGKTHRNMGLSRRFGIPWFSYERGEEGTRLVAEFTSDGIVARQVYTQRAGAPAIETHCEVFNGSGRNIVLESVPSFFLSRLSPFVRFNDEADLRIHRLRNYWSAEGMLVSDFPSALSMEDSWSGLGIRLEKFGQAGTMPANGWLPWAAVEDRTHGCTWAVQSEAPASWQMEIANVYNGISLCGGQADFTFGHWKKELGRGRSFATHSAWLTVCRGGLERAAQRLVHNAEGALNVPPAEEDLPVIYNEYCNSWGRPELSFVKEMLPVCKELGIGYFVVDAGWYREEGQGWNLIGDWKVNEEKFPGGLKEYAALCAKYGLRAGIWFEFENVSPASRVAAEHPDWLLTYAGKPIVHDDRCMLDFRKEEVRAYVHEKVTRLLLETGIRYIKCDYNESVGIGVDGAESLGEGLRRHAEAVLGFYRSLREEVPDLVIEICSSGGMRHEPLWSSLGSMSSFSDAHEGPEGAVIACRLHRFLPPRKMQVWAAVKDDYDENDTYFTLAKGMLGRLCLSGRLYGRTPAVMRAVREGVAFYGRIKDVLRDGETLRIRSDGIGYLRDIHGTQTLLRASADGKKLLWYCFAIGVPRRAVTEEVPEGYKLAAVYGNAAVTQNGNALTAVAADARMAGAVALLEKE